ncbi:COP9 signalosome [Fimicolochytrium jonesii]|uniref:COP9 signalosome n=1 Tax=Fimicolochytrium jonesii TaxID=1396493 RepID=UPI0022FEFD04|nr:COP9 signalosome [Fimicolochytrium jonesii]KAI8817967.1 COP9 signalosome [Fimicolochytrium jonesii]
MPGVLNEALAVYEQLKKEFNSPKADLQKCGQYLAKLKIYLTELSFLLPGDRTADAQELLLAREVLEIGAQWSIRVKDIPSFERYISQLKTYYNDYSKQLPESARTYPLLGLNLLRLLAQNRISEFHTELELINPDQLNDNVYIRHPIQIEQCLMEGSYNKVWHSRANVPAEEYLFFIDILMGTIRDEIARCSEKAYDSLPIPDAATLLYFKSESEVTAFATERGWKVNPKTKKITFGVTDTDNTDIPADHVILQTLEYARELERIV